MPHAGDVGAKRRAAEIVERSRECTPCCCGNRRLELGEDALAIALAKWNETGGGGDPVRNHCVKESVKGHLQRNRMRGAEDPYGHGINHHPAAGCDQPIKRGTIPGGAGYLDKRATLRRRFKLALARRHEGISQFRKLTKCCRITASRGAMGMRQKHRIAKSRTQRDRRVEPILERLGIADVARLHGPFDAAGIRERPDRKGWR